MAAVQRPGQRHHARPVRRRLLLASGQVWVTRARRTRTASRRVIAMVGDRVCYCSGTGAHRWCSRRAFRLWIRRYGAVSTRTRRPRTMQLRSCRPQG